MSDRNFRKVFAAAKFFVRNRARSARTLEEKRGLVATLDLKPQNPIEMAESGRFENSDMIADGYALRMRGCAAGRPGWSIGVGYPGDSDPVPGTRRLKGLASKQYRVCVRFTKIKRRSDTVGIPGEP